MRPIRAFALSCVLTGTVVQAAPSFQEHVVRRGQSASYIALSRYGIYNDSVAAFLRQDNPSIPDLDRLEVGQTLRLRDPLPPAEAAAPRNPEQRVRMASRKAVATLVRGPAQVVHRDGSRAPLRANQFLSPGEGVATGTGGFVELVIDNQSVLRLNQETEVRLVAIQEPRQPDARDAHSLYTRVALLKGRTWSQVRKWAGALVGFQVQMPRAIAGVHGTVFESGVSTDSSSSVAVLEGEVGVAGGTPSPRQGLAPREVSGPREIGVQEWIQVLKAGMRIEVDPSGRPGAPQTFSPDTASEWNRIDAERDCLCD